MRDHKICSILTSKSSDLDVNRKTEGEDSPEKPVCKTIPKGYQKQSWHLISKHLFRKKERNSFWCLKIKRSLIFRGA